MKATYLVCEYRILTRHGMMQRVRIHPRPLFQPVYGGKQRPIAMAIRYEHGVEMFCPFRPGNGTFPEGLLDSDISSSASGSVFRRSHIDDFSIELDKSPYLICVTFKIVHHDFSAWE